MPVKVDFIYDEKDSKGRGVKDSSEMIKGLKDEKGSSI
jgi:hypothetical protein